MEASNTSPTEPVDPVTEAIDTPPTSTTPAPSVQDDIAEILREIREQQAQHRAEVVALREELAKANQHNVYATPSNAAPATPEEALAARMNDVSQKDYYCPGCGRLYDYRQRCTGRAESPHPPIEVVSTDELKAGDESKHTAPVYVEQ